MLCYIDCFPIQVENVAAGNIFPEIALGDHDRVKSSWAGSAHVESPCSLDWPGISGGRTFNLCYDWRSVVLSKGSFCFYCVCI